MEGKKLSFVDELFPKKETTSSSKSDILSSIFPPRSSGATKDCSQYEASGVITGRKLGSDGHSLNVQSGTSGGSPLVSPSKRIISKKNNSPVLLCEIAEPCLMSSSVHYGGRDDFIPDNSSSRNSGTSYNFKIVSSRRTKKMTLTIQMLRQEGNGGKALTTTDDSAGTGSSLIRFLWELLGIVCCYVTSKQYQICV